jgi:hypothetical protein
VRAWVHDQGLRVVDWSVDGQVATISVHGPAEPTGVDGLAEAVVAAVGEPIELRIEYMKETTTVVPAGP